MNWKSKRVLITGAGGFIGSHLTERLVQAGAQTRALVHYRSNGSWGWLDDSPHRGDVEVLSGDVRDAEFVSNAVKGVDIVFHLAALIGIPYSYHAPESYVATNVVGTLNVLLAARRWSVSRVLQTSTSEVYGTARYVPIDEQHPLQGQSPYSASKIGADKLAESFFLSFGTPVVTVRPFNTFGPRQSARAVIPTIITQALAGESIRLGSLSPRRDLNFVSNTVEGFLKAAEVPSAIGQTINLGTGREVSVGELVKVVSRIIGCPLHVKTDTHRVRPPKSEVQRLLADIRLAKRILRWKPRIGLEEGLRQSVDWFRGHGHLYRADRYVI